MAKREALVRIEQSPFSGVGAIGASAGGGGGGSASAHALSDTTVHIGPLARGQAPWVGDDIASAIAQHTGIPNAHHNPVTPGVGIAVFNQEVSVNLAQHSGLIAAEHLQMGTPASVTSTTTNSVTGDTHTHTVVAHANAKNNPNHLVKSDANGRVVFSRVTTDQLWSDGILNFTPGSRIELTAGKEIRTTDSITGFLGSGWRMTNIDGYGFLDIRKIQVEELHAYAFVADIERVRVGETFVTQSMGILAADMIVPGINNSTTMVVENIPFFPGEIFADNEWVMLQFIDRSGGGLIIVRSWGQVSNYAAVDDDTQSWTYTHRSGTSGLHYKPGSYVLSFGKPGDGYIHQSVLDSGGSPYTRYATWSGANPYTPANRKVHVQVGNLDSITDTALGPTGFGLYGTNVFLKGSLLAADGDVRILKDDGINLKVLQAPNPFTSNISIEWWHDLDNRTVRPATEMYAWTLPNVATGELSTNFSLSSWGYQGGASGITIMAVGSVDAGLAAVIGLGSRGQNHGSSASILADTITLGRHLDDGVINLWHRAVTQHLSPVEDVVYDLGTGAQRYRAIYVNQLNATTISGTTLTGAEWEFGGSMIIDANANTNTLVTIANQGAGRADLFVDRDITLGGLVDGVDVGDMGSSYYAHITNSNAHHARVHVLADASGLGVDHTVTGLTTGHVLRATANNAARFMALNHTDLAGVNPNQHHNQNHVLATNTALGADHTISGGEVGWVLRVTGSTAARIMQLSHNDLGGVTPNQHHNQVHNIVGGDHTINGSQFQLVGATGANQLGLLTPSANPGATASILRTGTSGELTLRTLTVQGNVDIVSGGDLTVGNNVFFVDVSGFNVGINRAPDPQFDLDVLGNVRSGGWFVGRHAIQVDGALMICHYDGSLLSTDYTGDSTGHMGQVAHVNGPVIYTPGKFGTKAVQFAEPTTNMIPNPSFEGTYTDGIAPGWAAYSTGSAGGSRSSSFEALYGDVGQRITRTTGASADRYGITCTIASMSGSVMSGSVRFKVLSYTPGARVSLAVFRSSGQQILTQRLITDADLDQWVTLTGTQATSTAATTRITLVWIDQANADIVVDACQVEGKAYATPYCDGSLGEGHTWSGPANNSASSRAGSTYLLYPAQGNISAERGTLMLWASLSDNSGQFAMTQPGIFRWWNAFDSNSLYVHFSNDKSAIHVISYQGGVLRTNFSANINWLAGEWHHVAVSWQRGLVRLYIDGQLAASHASYVPPAITSNQLYIGRQFNDSRIMNGLIDDLVILGRVAPAAEIRAIYESDAPVFAESSTHQFRVGNGLVWGDAEGLFARDVDGNAVFAVVGVDAKSWGGFTLDKGDILIGNASSSYIWYDKSQPNIQLSNTDIVMYDAGVEYLSIRPALGVNITAPATNDDIGAGNIPGYAKYKYSFSQVGIGEIGGVAFQVTTSGAVQNKIALGAYSTANRDSYASVVASAPANRIAHASMWAKNSGLQIFNPPTGQPVTMSSQLISEIRWGGGTSFNFHHTRMGINLIDVAAGAMSAALTIATAGDTLLALQNSAVALPFIDFRGATGNNIAFSALGTQSGRVRVAINGQERWIALYHAP